MSRKEIKSNQINKFALSYPNEMTNNPGYFNPEEENIFEIEEKYLLNGNVNEWYENCN